jgi:hypothetical protein
MEVLDAECYNLFFLQFEGSSSVQHDSFSCEMNLMAGSA